MSSCPIPSRVRIEEGLFEASSSLFHVKLCLKGLIFETFIHFLRKKLFENKERPKSTRFCGLVLNTSSPPARSSQAHFAFKEWSCYGSGLPCSSSSSGLLVCMVTLPSMLPSLPLWMACLNRAPMSKVAYFCLNNGQLKALVMPPAQLAPLHRPL